MVNVLHNIMNDKVNLIKSNGQKYENIPANVQPSIIFIDDATIPIEEEDKLIRVLPNNLQEVYRVLDRGFYSDFGGFKAHYQVKVKKENAIDLGNRATNVNNFYGNVSNTQIQQDVQNSYQSISINDCYDKKEDLEMYISMLKQNINTVGLGKDDLKVVSNNVEILEKELKETKSKPKVINDALCTIRNVLEGVAGSLIASGLIYEIGKLIQ